MLNHDSLALLGRNSLCLVLFRAMPADESHRPLTVYLKQHRVYCGWPISEFTARPGSDTDD
jgi:hypothetical protein